MNTNSRIRFSIIALALLTQGFIPKSDAAGKEGEWVRIPSNWLLRSWTSRARRAARRI
jgi:hypothetical protein